MSTKSNLDCNSANCKSTNSLTLEDVNNEENLFLPESDYEAELQGENSEYASIPSLNLIENNSFDLSTSVKSFKLPNLANKEDAVWTPLENNLNSDDFLSQNNQYSEMKHEEKISVGTVMSPQKSTREFGCQSSIEDIGPKSSTDYYDEPVTPQNPKWEVNGNRYEPSYERVKLPTSERISLPSLNIKKNLVAQNFNPNNLDISTKSESLHEINDFKEQSYTSIVYMLTPEKNLYKLTFDVVNCFFRILYTERRDVDDGSNEKKNQPFSERVFRNGKPLKCRSTISLLNNLKMSFRTNSRIDKIICKEQQPVFKEDISFKKYKPIRRTKPSIISKTEKEALDSVIRATHRDIIFEIHPGVINVDKIKPNKPELPAFTAVKEKLHLTGTKDRLNKGQMVVRYKNDILLFRFEMVNITYGRYRTKVSVGTQIEASNSVFHQSFSTPNRRKIMIGVPKSLYEYEDKILKASYYNRTHFLNHRVPDWQLELRKQRLRESLIKPYEKDIEKVVKNFNNSFLLFEGLNCEIRAVTAVVNAYISFGVAAYEHYVKYEQLALTKGLVLKERGDEFAQTVDKQYDFKVPDFEMVTQKK